MQDTPLFKMWTAAKTAKFWVLALLLQLAGRKRLGEKLWNGWQVRCGAKCLCMHVSGVEIQIPCKACSCNWLTYGSQYVAMLASYQCIAYLHQ